jgi:hypothetical protein
MELLVNTRGTGIKPEMAAFTCAQAGAGASEVFRGSWYVKMANTATLCPITHCALRFTFHVSRFTPAAPLLLT